MVPIIEKKSFDAHMKKPCHPFKSANVINSFFSNVYFMYKWKSNVLPLQKQNSQKRVLKSCLGSYLKKNSHMIIFRGQWENFKNIYILKLDKITKYLNIPHTEQVQTKPLGFSEEFSNWTRQSLHTL